MRSRITRSRRSRRPRRGIALFTSLFFVAGIGALALSAIYLTANASLISKSYEKEDALKYASEATLAIGKASLNFNPAALPNVGFDTMMLNQTLMSADNQPIPGVTVNLYVGQTGSTSGQFGRFASLVAEARDPSGTGFVRRLELTQESFAKYAYWTNSETNNGQTIYFANGDQLWGPVWSNDDISINTSGATFHDQVGTAGTINGLSNGVFTKGYSIHQRPIQLPSLASLSSLSGLASVGGMSFTAPTTGDESTVRMRIEFVAADMDANGDSLGANEGFFRIYKANSGQSAWLRGDWPGTPSSLPAVSSVLNCGDWHDVDGNGLKFFPAAVHTQSWFSTKGTGDYNPSSIYTIMNHPGARCYLGGDPHLSAISRTTSNGYQLSDIQKGMDDTTFTPVDPRGSWQLYTNTPNGLIATRRQKAGDAKYLYPLYRGFNNSTKGVIYVSGTVGISGVLRGDITLYSPHTVVYLDDVRYANDPSRGVVCAVGDILGVIAGDNVIVADNGINTPQTIRTSGTDIIKSLDDTPDLYIHSVIMALGTSFQVEDYDQGPTNAVGCQGNTDGRGCLYLTGGLIQNNRGAVGLSSGQGYVKRYSYDRCAVLNPPPYFPTTGRFEDNRYYELDPVRFNPQSLFESLTPR